MGVPYLDLQLQYQGIKDEIQSAISKVLDNNSYILGPAVKDFEENFAAFCQGKYAVAVNSGTSALHLALLAAGIGPGDEVIIPAMSFLATISAVSYTGATPVLVDIGSQSYCIDSDQIEAVITSATKAIMPVHLYGQAADMDRISAIADKHGLIVIEDAAQAHGAEYKGRVCGSLGKLAGFSFYPGKNLGAFGEGGAVVTDDPQLAEKVRMLRDWGAKERYQHVIKGFNYRMDGIQGAVLGVKLKYIQQWNEQRRCAAAWYDESLADCNVILPVVMEYGRPVHHIYAVCSEERDRLLACLKAADIGCGIHYPTPLHLQECFLDLGYKKGDFPVAEKLADTELSLPIFPEMTQQQVEQVAACIRQG